MSDNPPSIFIIGAGPGIGAATARRYAREGHSIGLISRYPGPIVEALRAEDITVEGAIADITLHGALEAAIEKLTLKLGMPRVVLFSPHPDVNLIEPVADTTSHELRSALELTLLGSVKVVQIFRNAMRDVGGTLLFTTGSGALSPTPERVTSAVAALAVTRYLELVQQTVTSSALSVHHVTISGAVGDGRKHRPEAIAELLWKLNSGPTGATIIR